MSIKENPLVTLIEESIRLRDSAQKILSDAMGGRTLTRIERLVLVMITEADSPLTASQIGRDLGHSRQVVQRAVNRLVELGLLQKLPNPHHKASALLETTAKGLKFEKQMGDVLNEAVGTLLSDGDIKKCRRISRDLKALRSRIESLES